MNKLLLFFGLLMQMAANSQAPTINYSVDSASVEHAGVPKGEVLKFVFENSKIFPGTWREFWIYVPAQYQADKPACVYVNQDGIQWKEQFPHHTAIVYEVTAMGEYKIANQNTTQTGRKVGITEFHLKDVKKGKVTFYRPVNK